MSAHLSHLHMLLQLCGARASGPRHPAALRVSPGVGRMHAHVEGVRAPHGVMRRGMRHPKRSPGLRAQGPVRTGQRRTQARKEGEATMGW